MLTKQLEVWSQYPANVQIVVVDDGSPLHPISGVLAGRTLPNVAIYRINENVEGNVAGARNLAFLKAHNGWVVNLDIDHILPAISLNKLLKIESTLDPSRTYLPYRMQQFEGVGLKPLAPHSDTYILTRDLYWSIGGFDEALTGYYHHGACSHFKEAIKRTHPKVLNEVYTVYCGTDIVEDSNPLGGMPKKTHRGEWPVKKTLFNYTWNQIQL